MKMRECPPSARGYGGALLAPPSGSGLSFGMFGIKIARPPL